MRVIFLKQAKYTEDCHIVKTGYAGEVKELRQSAAQSLFMTGQALRIPDDADAKPIQELIKGGELWDATNMVNELWSNEDV